MWRWGALLAALTACSAEEEPAAKGGFDYPKDGELRLNHVQAKASHNSYHVAESQDIEALTYSHAALDVQLAEQGVRGFELDTRWDSASESFVVYHLPVIDDISNCATLVLCLSALKGWSDANPAHHALFVQIEPKDGVPGVDAESHFSRLEAEILSVWPRERILAPDDVRGGASTLREAIVTSGWPTLGETRGKLLFFVDESGEFRDAYTRGGQNLDGRLMFVDSEPGAPYEATYVLNDPESSDVAARVAEGFIVRTRADGDNVEPLANDTTRRDAAFASGAQIVSTDYPTKVEGIEYVVELPGGTPSRCNPVTAPSDCTAEDVENPTFIR